MLTKDKMRDMHRDIHTGMYAYTSDGEKLGKVQHLDAYTITIEKGLFFPKDFLFRYDDIVDVREDHLILKASRADLEKWRDAGAAGRREPEGERTGTKVTKEVEKPERREEAAPHEETPRREETTRQEEKRIPLYEEEIEPVKQERKGEVRVHKVVHTETKHMTVPVRKEEVVVERTPVKERSERDAGEAKFQEEEVRIPIVEEEIEIRKRPVVREEVRVHKEAHTEDRDVSAEIRTEDVEVAREEPQRKEEKK